MTTAEKLHWIKGYDNSFKEEFNADRKLNQQLDKNIEDFIPIFLFLQSSEFTDVRNLILENLTFSKIALQNIRKAYDKNSMSTPLQYFIQSIFHMAINRLFTSQQRLFEMVIYDYLYRYYKTKFYLDSNKHSVNDFID